MRERIPDINQERTAEREPERNVLKLSEGMMTMNGNYVGEIGNIRYQDNESMFVYDPDSGVIIDGTGKTVEMNPDDLVAVPHNLGYVTFRHLLGNTAGDVSGKEFESKLYKLCRDTEEKVEKISCLTEPYLEEKDDRYRRKSGNEEVDTALIAIGNTGQKNRYTPEQLLNSILGQKREHFAWANDDTEAVEEFSSMLEKIQRTGVLSDDISRRRDGIINYTYLFCAVNGIDASHSEAVHAMLNEYPFTEELVKEYRRSPDVRFGDGLLVGLGEYLRENRDFHGE